MPDGFVSATEANRQFSKLLREVEGGARVTITKDGKPVAILAPVHAEDGPARESARKRMLDLMRQGMPLGFRGGVDRDEAHAR